MRKDFTFFMGLLIILPKELSARQPHIIIILADDLGFNDLSFRGSNEIPTPNIDALAYGGIILNRHYVLPTCTPSRTALLTGLYPIALGSQGPPLKAGEPSMLPVNVKLMPEYFRDVGYKTHMLGKWHLGYQTEKHVPFRRGFDSFLGYYNGYIDYYNLDYNQTVDDGPGEEFFGYDLHDEHSDRWDLKGLYATEVFTKAAVDVIKNHNQEEPLFLYVSHLAAHTGTEEGHGLQAPPDFDVDGRFDYIESVERRNYDAIVTSLDDSVGQIIGALGDSKMLDNSIVLFMSDNGAPTVSANYQANYGSNWPLRGTKFTLYEGGVRGAAALWSPLLPQSYIYENVVHITDWLPTLLHVAGGKPENFHGENKWDMLLHKNGTNPNILLNIDEKENAEAALLSGLWKIVKQNMRMYANYDYHFRVPRNISQISEVTPDDIRNSIAGKALQDFGVTFQDENISKLRKDATLHCKPTQILDMGVVEPSTDFFCKNYCIFNVQEDPCELNPISDKDILLLGETFLNEWSLQLKPQGPGLVDERSNPAFFNGAWAPWLSVSGVLPLSENAASIIGTLAPIILTISGMLIKRFS